METNLETSKANPGSEEILTRRLADDYFYPETHQERDLKDSSLPSFLYKYH